MKIGKVPINRDRLNEALKRKGLSINKLGQDGLIGVTDKTIRRAQKNNEINPEILERMGEHLDADTYWLMGKDMEWIPLVMNKINKEKLLDHIKIENNPYNKNRYERKQELNLVTQMVVFKYFSKQAGVNNPFCQIVIY